MLNIIGFLSMNSVDVAKCKREVFQAIDLIQKIQDGDARWIHGAFTKNVLLCPA